MGKSGIGWQRDGKGKNTGLVGMGWDGMGWGWGVDGGAGVEAVSAHRATVALDLSRLHGDG